MGGLVGELAGFFTLAALITFGGAYAVLPFVANQAVHHYGWLSARDMVAGLALGESTPGPLIMVNTFVGFLAGYNVEGGLAWGVLGATIATLCTFVPSFVFIINGAPIIDRIKTTGPVADALNGVTIAVVGVIGGLAVFVADHALIVDDRPDRVLTPLAIAAFVAVWRYRVGVAARRRRVRRRRAARQPASLTRQSGGSSGSVVDTVRHESQVILRIVMVIARPIRGSAMPAPAATAAGAGDHPERDDAVDPGVVAVGDERRAA